MQAHRDAVEECETITQKIETLLAELQELKKAVEARPAVGTKPLPWNQAITGLGAFERIVLAEKRNVTNMLRQATDYPAGSEGAELDAILKRLAGRLRIKLDACNHKFHDIVWSTAKKSYDLCGLRCEYYRTPARLKNESVIVDVIAGGGTEWIKIVTTTERRICYEMTDAGWDWEWEPDDDDDDDDEPPLPEDGDSEVEVARVARHLVAAACLTYVEYRRPSVKIILSRITSGSNAHVDRLLDYVRTFGGDDIELTVETADRCDLLLADTPPLDVALPRLVSHDPFRDFTATLNVDCSVFMALASDFSHMVITRENPLLRSKQHHIDAGDEMEHGPRLLTTMYPAMVGRDLVCTQDAADTFLKIAYDIGTETEQARARILFTAVDDDGVTDPGEDRRRRIAELARLSVYDVPEDLRLPICTVDTVTWDDAQRLVQEGELPRVALVVGRMGSGLNAMNVSSFLYGWRASLTTVTSNWEAAKRLKTVIEANRTAADERGPHIWRIPFARKLLAKPRVTGLERAPIKTRRERKQEKMSSLQRWVGEDGGDDDDGSNGNALDTTALDTALKDIQEGSALKDEEHKAQMGNE